MWRLWVKIRTRTKDIRRYSAGQTVIISTLYRKMSQAASSLALKCLSHLEECALACKLKGALTNEFDNTRKGQACDFWIVLSSQSVTYGSDACCKVSQHMPPPRKAAYYAFLRDFQHCGWICRSREKFFWSACGYSSCKKRHLRYRFVSLSFLMELCDSDFAKANYLKQHLAVTRLSFCSCDLAHASDLAQNMKHILGL